MRFGISTHLYHDQRLTPATTCASSPQHGFDAHRAVRDAQPLRLPRRRRRSTSSPAGCARRGLDAALDPRARSSSASSTASGIGPLSLAAAGRAGAARGPSRETAAALEHRAARSRSASSSCTSACRTRCAARRGQQPARGRDAASRRSRRWRRRSACAWPSRSSRTGCRRPDALVRLLEDELDLPASRHLPRLRPRVTCMGDLVDAIETVSGHLVTTHVHDNRGQRRRSPRAVRGHHRLGRRR